MRRLGTPDVTAIGRPDGPTFTDAADDALAQGTPEQLASDLTALVGEKQVLTRALDLIRYASDASPYRYIPQVVVVARHADDVRAVLEYCRKTGRHATFRSGGTSLNGQAQSDDVLIDTRRNFYGIQVEDQGRKVRVKPGTILNHVNAVLRRHGRRLGPDPASANVATIGGVVANNAGGMRCTLARNSYHTVNELTFTLPSGTTLNTAAPGAEDAFAAAEPELAKGLLALRQELLADTELADRVRRKFSIRNTNGYILAALLDAETPLEIFRRLLIGSEGTLGFVSEVVYDTLPNPAFTTVAWIPVNSINDAADLVADIEEAGAEAVELMLGAALNAAGKVWKKTPEYWEKLPADSAALLIEFRRDSADELSQDEARVAQIVKDHKTELLHSLDFTRDPKTIELYWTVRDGLMGVIGKMRPAGTALIIEDVCFPPKRIAEGARDLQGILSKHGYTPSVAGHAAYGNLHFTLITGLGSEKDRQRYSDFMQDLVALVIDKYDGSLKAEHGTGINMAPFVRHEWGDKAADMMWRIKRLADPHAVLGKNVMLSEDEGINLKQFKSTPPIEDVATHCIECGFCEGVCPSRNVTATPRQRIVLRREMARQAPDSALLTTLEEEYEYDGIETCAVDGNCATVCPVGINTGELVKGFRRDESSKGREKVALSMAKRWATVEALARDAVGAADIVQQTVGTGVLTAITKVARAAISEDLVPMVPGPMPRPAAAKLPDTRRTGAVAVYFPACVNRIFGRSPGDARDAVSLPEVLVKVSERAGKPLWIPDDVRGKCCATPWSSKGYVDGNTWMAQHTVDAMWKWSDQGRLPVVVDAASCTFGISQEIRDFIDKDHTDKLDAMTIQDSIEWCNSLLPDLTVSVPLSKVAVHPTCSTTHLGLNDMLSEVVGRFAHEVYVPVGTTCCGTAGDRGLLHPELVESAVREEKAGLDATPVDAYVSANRTCEMGMLQATGRPYESFIFLLEELTRP